MLCFPEVGSCSRYCAKNGQAKQRNARLATLLRCTLGVFVSMLKSRSLFLALVPVVPNLRGYRYPNLILGTILERYARPKP